MHAPDVSVKAFRAGTAACAAAGATFLLVPLATVPPHEDETLALFVGRGSLGSLAHVVLGERGGAPLHFVAAWLVAHGGGGPPGLPLVSGVFAVASVPLGAALASRLTDRTTGLLATWLASASWVLLFHGIYARMYSLFLFTSALSYLLLLRALESGGRRRWAAWGAATVLCIATHPYGALVLASQGVYILVTRARLREAVLSFAAVVVLATPFW